MVLQCAKCRTKLLDRQKSNYKPLLSQTPIGASATTSHCAANRDTAQDPHTIAHRCVPVHPQLCNAS